MILADVEVSGVLQSGDFRKVMYVTRDGDKASRLRTAVLLMQLELEPLFNVSSGAVTLASEDIGTAERITVGYYSLGVTGEFLRVALNLLADTVNTTEEPPSARSVQLALSHAAFVTGYDNE